ncbi:MAG: DUF6967 family protein [Sulfuriferula sp.]
MEEIIKLDKFSASPFKQEIELQQVEHAVDFINLRVRIREGSRFTVFDIDEHTALRWGQAMLEWVKTRRQTKEEA